MADEAVKMIPVKTTDTNGYRMLFQLKGVPVQFANAIRRIMLNEMPVVEIANVVIHENNTLMPHEMMQLRTQLLPVNVRPTEEDLIRSAKISLNVAGERKVYSSDFIVTGGRSDILLKDRDTGAPLYFMKMKEGDKLMITAGLTVNTHSSHACVATYMFHIDEERAIRDKAEFVDANGGSPEAEKAFDNFYRQRSYARNEKGRPFWYDFEVESIGVMPARDIVKDALTILKKLVLDWTKSDIIREKEENAYRVQAESGGHTAGALVQAVLYDSGLCSFCSYDIPHPLRTDMVVRFQTAKTPEDIMTYVATKVSEYCDTCLSEL